MINGTTPSEVDMPTLPAADAEAFIRRIAPQVGKKAAQLAKACDYSPFVLRLAGGVFTQHPDLTSQDYMQQLAEVRQQHSLVDAAFTLSYRFLNETQQQYWQMLTIFPDSFLAL